LKFLKVVSFIALTVGLVGCSDTQSVNEVPKDTGKRFNGIDADEINIVTDSKTGCKYIYVEDGLGNNRTTAMSPLYIDSNTVDCTK
jgi:hypothetical protein